MPEYIDKNLVLNMILYATRDPDELMKFIKDLPTIDVAPVRHGKWIEREEYPDSVSFSCSECGEAYMDEYDMLRNGMFKYCPNCGAKMDASDVH